MGTVEATARVEELFLRINGSTHVPYADLLHPDCVYRFPLSPEGYVSRLDGAAAIEAFLDDVRVRYRDFVLTILRTWVVDDGSVVFVEYESNAVHARTAKPYRNRYLGYLEIRGDQVSTFVEYYNPLVVLDANSPGDPQ